MPDDASDPAAALVSAPEKHDTVCLALEHHLYFCLPLHSGLDLFLCLDFPRFDDFDRFYGTPQQCPRNLYRRRFILPRKELEKQSDRPVFSIIRNDIPVSRYALRHILLLL